MSLEDLVVKDEKVTDEMLVAVLRPYVSFTEDGALLPSSVFGNLSSKLKITVVLLCAVGLHRLGKRKEKEIAPKEIAEMSGIPAGTVRPVLKDLLKNRLITVSNGLYTLPPRSFQLVNDLLESVGTNGK